MGKLPICRPSPRTLRLGFSSLAKVHTTPHAHLRYYGRFLLACRDGTTISRPDVHRGIYYARSHWNHGTPCLDGKYERSEDQSRTLDLNRCRRFGRSINHPCPRTIGDSHQPWSQIPRYSKPVHPKQYSIGRQCRREPACHVGQFLPRAWCDDSTWGLWVLLRVPTPPPTRRPDNRLRRNSILLRCKPRQTKSTTRASDLHLGSHHSRRVWKTRRRHHPTVSDFSTS